MGAFCRRIEDNGVLGGFDVYDFFVGSYEGKLGHAEWAGIVSLTWDNACVGYHCWFVKCFFASFVWAF